MESYGDAGDTDAVPPTKFASRTFPNGGGRKTVGKSNLKSRAGGLVVKSNVAIVGPRVRFSAGAPHHCLACRFCCPTTPCISGASGRGTGRGKNEQQPRGGRGLDSTPKPRRCGKMGDDKVKDGRTRRRSYERRQDNDIKHIPGLSACRRLTVHYLGRTTEL